MGTIHYRAIEILLGTPPADATTAVDIWSAGCLLAFMLQGEHLFPPRSQVGMIWAILKQRGGEPTSDLEALPCWPTHPPNFRRPPPWPGRLPLVLGLAGESLLGQVLALSPSARPTASDCLAHEAMRAVWPPGDGSSADGSDDGRRATTSPRRLAQPALHLQSLAPRDRPQLARCELDGARGPWRFLAGRIEDDLLQWLRDDPLFQDPAGWHSWPWNWTGRGSNWYSELGRKFPITGELGPCAGTS